MLWPHTYINTVVDIFRYLWCLQTLKNAMFRKNKFSYKIKNKFVFKLLLLKSKQKTM